MGEIRPSHPLGPFAAEQHVDAAAERITVDQHGPPPGPGRGHREGTGQGGRAGAAPAADHPHGERRPAHAFRRIGDLVDEPTLRIGQPQHIFGSDLHSAAPDVRGVLIPADEHHAPPAHRPSAPLGGVVAHQNHRSPLPTASVFGQRVMNFRFRSSGRTQPQQIVEQFHILGHDQRSAPPHSGGRQTIPRDGLGHDLRPLHHCTFIADRGDPGAFRDRRFHNPRTSRLESPCSASENRVDLARKLWTTPPLWISPSLNRRLPERTPSATQRDESCSWETEREAGRRGRNGGRMPGSERQKRVRTCDDPRRGGERGSSPRPTRGEEPDRVSTVANDP